MFTHGAPIQRARARALKVELEFRNVGFCGGRKTGVPEKSRSKDENQQQTQPTYDAESGNRTRATSIAAFRCDAIKIKIENHSMNEVKKFTRYRR